VSGDCDEVSNVTVARFLRLRTRIFNSHPSDFLLRGAAPMSEKYK
jgi:hypothetical protein